MKKLIATTAALAAFAVPSVAQATDSNDAGNYLRVSHAGGLCGEGTTWVCNAADGFVCNPNGAKFLCAGGIRESRTWGGGGRFCDLVVLTDGVPPSRGGQTIQISQSCT